MTDRYRIALLLFPLLLGGCQRVDESAPAAGADASATAVVPVPAAAASVGPLQEFFDYRLIETAKGVRHWVLGAERMLKYADREEVELMEVHMDFYRAGEHFSVLEADSGRVNPRTRAVHVWGAVDVTTDDGKRLQTEDLNFNNETGRITNEVFNRYTDDRTVLTGFDLDATPDLESVEIKREVAAVVVDTATPEGRQP
jgi:LPS export ABC transporter protein LptC